MSETQETVLEIDLKALQHNFEYLKSKLHKNTKTLAVVKAFGYGTDACIVAKHLEKLKVDYFAVAYAKEGVALRGAGIKTPILVLHPQIIDFKDIIKYCLEPNLYSKRTLEAFIKVAESENQKYYPTHIKFNTGLNRLGFNSNEIDSIIEKTNKTKSIKIASIFSHLVASEDLKEKDFSEQQIRTFKDIINKVKLKIDYSPLFHMTNTSGVLNFPNAHFDMVRIGIGLYGFANDEKLTKNLKNVASLKSIISQIHTIEKGQSVGYNRAFKANKNIKTATIPIGHADGIHRAFGNGKASVKINGAKAPIVGNVCMDMLMVNISEIDCEEGDEVIIFNDQKTINEWADIIKSIPYEILTTISQRVKRIVK
ncbi:alanine racemase [Aureibaculum sp. 2210JD6-5]|uniref:alanine racemase n=1 Tax=Aureibaculum sp. 2210JD6-5 TaxID=3103957 RepID=UPI002AAD32C0|nr:alanine racemase [Aureibaculum sp. 2210JD6-5]MDY7396536.1 alanine racemase [Aureibaculum sp. 2210JD6-5]